MENAPNPVLITFARGVVARLTLWSTLRLAVEQSWGGPESASKQTWMASILVDLFDPTQVKEPPEWEDIEEMLLQMMSDEFECNVEDGTSEVVAKDIMKLWHTCGESQESGEALVVQWEERAQKAKGEKVKYQQEDVDEEDWEDDSDEGEGVEEQVPTLLSPAEKKEPEVDEDGFTVVKGKGKGRSS